MTPDTDWEGRFQEIEDNFRRLCEFEDTELQAPRLVAAFGVFVKIPWYRRAWNFVGRVARKILGKNV